MMVVLNSRMVYGIENATVSVSPIVVIPQGLQAGVSVTHEQWSVTHDHPEDFKMVSVAIQTLISILNFGE
jgi:hypothetical protein